MIVALARKLVIALWRFVITGETLEGVKQAYRLADNELAARANLDSDLLRSELRDLKFGGVDLDLIGFEPDRLDDVVRLGLA